MFLWVLILAHCPLCRTRFPTDWACHWPKIHTQASLRDEKSFLISFPSKCRFLCFPFFLSSRMYNDSKDDEADCDQSRNVAYSHHQMITATINYDQFCYLWLFIKGSEIAVGENVRRRMCGFSSFFSGKTASPRKSRDKTHKEKKYKRECVVEG